MTESNKTVTILWQPVRWSRANFCSKGVVRNVAHPFDAQFTVRFQATKQQSHLRIRAEMPHKAKALVDRFARSKN